MTDLPLSGRIIELLVIARRFRCNAVLCGRHIFIERFEGRLAPWAPRTAKLGFIRYRLGLALGRLMLPVSKDTLPRASPPDSPTG